MKIKATPIKQDAPVVALNEWRAVAHSILLRLYSDSAKLIEEVIRRRSPLYGAVAPWSIKEFMGQIDDAIASLTNFQVEVEHDIEGIPDPFGT